MSGTKAHIKGVGLRQLSNLRPGLQSKGALKKSSAASPSKRVASVRLSKVALKILRAQSL